VSGSLPNKQGCAQSPALAETRSFHAITGRPVNHNAAINRHAKTEARRYRFIRRPRSRREFLNCCANAMNARLRVQIDSGSDNRRFESSLPSSGRPSSLVRTRRSARLPQLDRIALRIAVTFSTSVLSDISIGPDPLQVPPRRARDRGLAVGRRHAIPPSSVDTIELVGPHRRDDASDLARRQRDEVRI